VEEVSITERRVYHRRHNPSCRDRNFGPPCSFVQRHARARLDPYAGAVFPGGLLLVHIVLIICLDNTIILVVFFISSELGPQLTNEKFENVGVSYGMAPMRGGIRGTEYPCSPNPRRMNTCRTVSKQTTLNRHNEHLQKSLDGVSASRQNAQNRATP
jgi:hypothetical protein